MPEEAQVDDAALARAEEYLGQGKDQDAVRGLINPHYSGWGPIQQRVFRSYLDALLEMRRTTKSSA